MQKRDIFPARRHAVPFIFFSLGVETILRLLFAFLQIMVCLNIFFGRLPVCRFAGSVLWQHSDTTVCRSEGTNSHATSVICIKTLQLYVILILLKLLRDFHCYLNKNAFLSWLLNSSLRVTCRFYTNPPRLASGASLPSQPRKLHAGGRRAPAALRRCTVLSPSHWPNPQVRFRAPVPSGPPVPARAHAAQPPAEKQGSPHPRQARTPSSRPFQSWLCRVDLKIVK